MIDLGSVVNQGLIGMQKSQTSMVQSAQQIAQTNVTQQAVSAQNAAADVRLRPQDVAEPLINLKIQSHVFDSSARVIKSADETIGTLLDTKA